MSYVEQLQNHRREREERRNEMLLMGRLLAVLCVGGGASVLYLGLLVDQVDLIVIAATAACFVLAPLCLLIATRQNAPRQSFMSIVMLGTAISIGVTQYLDRIDTGFFLLLPAVFTAVFYWRDRVLMIASLAVYMAAFVANPLIVGGSSQIARVATTGPIFLAFVLITGYLGSKSHEMNKQKSHFQSTIASLLVALQERDGYTADHSEETVDLAMAVGDRLKITDEERTVLADVALLHDIGKIGIPNEILYKPADLNDEEWEFMKKHPEIGERIVAPVPGFSAVAEAIRHEHERWDGDGYPDGLAGEDIPLASRIVLVCDAFHAMITDRPYRKSIGLRQARSEMIRHGGTQFDPAVVEALLAVIDSNEIPDSVGNAAWDGSSRLTDERLLQPAAGQ